MFLFIAIALALAEQQPSRLERSDVRGKALYQQYCMGCHGEKALGDGPLATSSTPTAPALAGIFQQNEYPSAIRLIQDGKGSMPAYEQLLDRTDTKKILIYLRRLDPQTGENLREKKEKNSPEQQSEEATHTVNASEESNTRDGANKASEQRGEAPNPLIE